MKSRVLNTKHLQWNADTKTFIGYTKQLKPSLFNTNKKIHREENYLWLQSQVTNKMTKWIKTSEYVNNEKTLIWVYEPEDKWLEKFPKLKGCKTEIVWDGGKIL